MHRSVRLAVCLLALFSSLVIAQNDTVTSYDYEVARKHELKPHRRTIPQKGVESGFNQLHLTLTISPAGDVVKADAGGEPGILKFWPAVETEVRQWKFKPFLVDGKAVTAEVEEYIDLTPPERLPKVHVPPPAVRPNSDVAITLTRTGCFGSCPSYSVAVTTKDIEFQGHGFVVAAGTHRDKVAAKQVRELAKRFVAADFFSMESRYRAGVTDNPTYLISITIDGHTKRIEDYVGSWEGMPAVITELEDEVDAFARTERWIEGSEGLVQNLTAEGFDFKTFEAQVMLKEAARREQTSTVQEFLSAGVPIVPLLPPKASEDGEAPPFEGIGWLTSASDHPEVLKLLIEAGLSKYDQTDKNFALVGAARSGRLKAVRMLIAYGANPKADLSTLTVVREGGGMTIGEPGAGSVLIYAAESGDPDVVREILRYKPKLEMRDYNGKTAIFHAGDYRDGDKDGARVECVRLLAEAGADVNARDKDGNTPLHETFLTDVEEELLKLGADVNARNNDGETPIFTNVDNDGIALFLEHGADLSIRNNEGETVMEAAKKRGPAREEALRKAIQSSTDRR